MYFQCWRLHGRKVVGYLQYVVRYTCHRRSNDHAINKICTFLIHYNLLRAVNAVGIRKQLGYTHILHIGTYIRVLLHLLTTVYEYYTHNYYVFVDVEFRQFSRFCQPFGLDTSLCTC